MVIANQLKVTFYYLILVMLNNMYGQSNKTAIIGAVIGSLFGGILLLSFGGFFLYKWNKNRQKQEDSTPIPRNKDNIYNHGQEIVQPSNVPTSEVINESYNHGQESIPIANDEKLLLQELKQEIQDLM